MCDTECSSVVSCHGDRASQYLQGWSKMGKFSTGENVKESSKVWTDVDIEGIFSARLADEHLFDEALQVVHDPH